MGYMGGLSIIYPEPYSIYLRGTVVFRITWADAQNILLDTVFRNSGRHDTIHGGNAEPSQGSDIRGNTEFNTFDR